MSETLVLVPTAMERERLEELGGFPDHRVEVCGFGPVAAAARAAQLAERHPGAALLLVGIAGTHDEQRHPVGSVVEPGRVLLDGVGAGSGADALGPEALGFPQWAGEAPIFDAIELGEDDATLLTVCAASANEEEAELRRSRFGEIAAEDLEGFGVALAARVTGAPLRIVRGLSNRAGDRDHTHWRIDDALAAAHELALAILGHSHG